MGRSRYNKRASPHDIPMKAAVVRAIYEEQHLRVGPFTLRICLIISHSLAKGKSLPMLLKVDTLAQAVNSCTELHKTTVSRLCQRQGRGSFFLKEIATAYQHFLCLERSAQLTHLTKVSCSDVFYQRIWGCGTFCLAFT